MLIGGELVQCQTEDSIRLHGYFLPAAEPPRVGIDAILISHAIGGNYYNSRFLNRLALTCHDLGLPVLMANNRGHDVVNYVAAGMGRRSIGAAYEIVSECQYDYDAWIRLLLERGFQNVVVIGHSLGAIKALYSQSFRRHKRVAGIVSFSASRLRYQDFIESPHRDRFLGFLEQARELCASGQGQQLIDVDFPFPILISAATYVDKYDSDDRYNWLSFVGRIKVPTWLAFGQRELEDNAAFQGIIEQFNSLELNSQQFSVEIIPNANHYYTGCQQVAADAMAAWLQRTFPSGAM